MEQTPNDAELLRMISDANDHAISGRLERLRFLMTNESNEPTPFSGLAHEYFEEARLCWYVGAFVATIVLTQLALEESLRSHFRVVCGVQGTLPNGKSVDQAGFADLINESYSSGLVSENEKDQLHKLRRDFRNPYVHPKDVDKDHKSTRSDFFRQQLKIVAPDLTGESSITEAKQAIQILVNLLPRISRRMYGI